MFTFSVYEADYKVGETVADETNSQCYDFIGERLLSIFQDCKTKEEYNLANEVLEAVCGNKIEKILETVHERDANHHRWSLMNFES